MSWLGGARRELAECASTNDEAAAWARAGAPAGALVIAEAQSAGRGRQGRRWHSPAGNLYLSAVLRPAISPRAAPPITLAAAVALAEAVAREGANPELKWPNDLLIQGRKVAGILTEMTTVGQRIDFVVLGLGVNLNGSEFPEDLRDRATSLGRVLGRPVDRAAFVDPLCERLEHWMDRFVADGAAPVVAAWKGFARLWGREVTVADGRATLHGVAEDLAEDGALLLRTRDGALHRVVAGELTA